MSSAPRSIPRYTAADYASWHGDWELIDGVAMAMTPSPFGRHAEKLSRMAATLWNAIEAAGCRATVLAEIDWIIGSDTVVRPDLVVVCGPAPERHVVETPALVVEILSAATRARDLTIKRDLYEAQRVRWYLIIDPDEGQSALLRLNATGRYEPVPLEHRQAIELCPGCVVAVTLEA
jgi:Uma2 family endonuclease